MITIISDYTGRKISPIEYGNMHKVHRPNDDCEDPFEEDEEPENTLDSCSEFVSLFFSLLYIQG